jgi:transposase
MKLESIDIETTIENTKRLLEEDQSISPSLKASIELLLVLVTLLLNRLGLNSSNSSKPPSSDPNREKKKKEPGSRKPGGQKGHNGTTLKKVANPDIIEDIALDPTTLPPGDYKEAGYDARQVIDIDISQIVTEYRAQILEDAKGKRYTASFPDGVSRPIQYGINIKAQSVYLSQYQLIPYSRIEETFHDQADIPVSGGSIFNFNEEAYEKLEAFEDIVRSKLIQSALCHADETGINIDGKRRWLHCVSNDLWTFFLPHEKRGIEAMDAMGVLPEFSGILCHDHWKPYFRFSCEHALCNAHHLRELQRAWEQDGQDWARDLRALLLEINAAVENAGGKLDLQTGSYYRQKYKRMLEKAQNKCPPPDENQRKGKRGRLKRSKSRNLLERLIEYENETLRFMEDERVPFTNNQGENDIRMTKVQQKISGCFRSEKGAAIFCRVRSYLSTCKKHGVMASEALRLLFAGKSPGFLNE